MDSKIIIKPFYTIKLADKKGNIRFQETKESHSWVRNYYHYIFVSATSYTGNTTDSTQLRNTSNSLAGNFYNNLTSGDNNQTWWNNDIHGGPVIGTGTNAESFDNYNLTLIDNGTSSGKMSYDDVIAIFNASAAPTYQITLSRLFTNASGGTITVGEVGLYGFFYNDGTFLLNRDLLGATVAVLDTETFYLQYDLSMTLPA